MSIKSTFARTCIILLFSLIWAIPGCKEDDPLVTKYGSFKDKDGNTYRTVTIGSQEWMCENLRVTHYQNGDTIYETWSPNSWNLTEKGGWCYYQEEWDNFKTYGLLYNWKAVKDPRNIAPAGWRVASDNDWQILITALGGSNVAGAILKEMGTGTWKEPNVGATDQIGFSARPGGYCTDFQNYTAIGSGAYFWTTTEEFPPTAKCRYLVFNHGTILSTSLKKGYGLSVRCVRDTDF